jgi:hypothetical protein
MNGGDLLFVPNRALGTNTTKENSYKIYHTGNKPTYSDVGAAAASHTHDDRYYTETEINNMHINKEAYLE